MSEFQTLVQYNDDLDELILELRLAKEACVDAKKAEEELRLTPQEFLLGPDAQMMLPPGWMMFIELGQGLNEFMVVGGEVKHRSSSPGWGRVQTITAAGGF